MNRLLCFPLLAILALPLFAQETRLAPFTGQDLPRHPALLARMKDQVSQELQQVTNLIAVVGNNEPQLAETLKARQAELTKQLKDIAQQTQADTTALMQPRAGMPATFDSMMGQPMQFSGQSSGGIPTQSPVVPNRGNETPFSPNDRFAPGTIQPMPMPQVAPMTPPMPPGMGGMMEQPLPLWQSMPQQSMPTWGGPPNIPKELTDVKQSVDSLQKEIVELKETIKALETQIQLLTRNILLSERVRENGN